LRPSPLFLAYISALIGVLEKAQVIGNKVRIHKYRVSFVPVKFPTGYIIEADKGELVENFHRFKNLKHSTVQPKAFTEKGLYILATILKSPQATAATIAIIEAFSKLRELSHAIAKLTDAKEKPEQQSLIDERSEVAAVLART